MSKEIEPEDIEQLEKRIREFKSMVSNQLDEISQELQELKRQAQYKLIQIDEAAKLLGVSDRQIHNLANDPKIPIKKYNKDGTVKKNNRKTPIRFNRTEILDYKS